MFLELVEDNLSNRPGKCIEKQLLGKYRREAKTSLYRSVFIFKNRFEGSVSTYMGDYSIDNIIFDIDFTTKIETLNNARNLVKKLSIYMEPDNFLVFFSGNGFHIQVHANAFGFKDSHALPRIVKASVMKFTDLADTSFYNNSGLIRIAHTQNHKNQLYKIPLEYNELFVLDYDSIASLASTPRWDFDYTEYDYCGDNELAEFVDEELLSIKEYHPKVENTRIATCIHNILGHEPQSGTRHNMLLLIASHFRRNGIPMRSAILSLVDWLKNDDFKENDIIRTVENAYTKPYVFSCKHKLLQNFCSPSCVFYGNKNYGSEVMTIDQVHEATIVRATTDFSTSTLNIDEMFNIHEEHRIYPGELCTFFGLTGSGKTALVQQIVAGITVYGNQLPNRLSTLYLSLEMSQSQMYRRWIQQIMGYSKKEAYASILKNPYAKELSHIRMRCLSPTLDTIEEEVRLYRPQVLVVDHLELVKSTNSFSKNKITEITGGLKQIALKYDIIALQVSQVSRGYSREGVLDLYAGKESGSIEADSDKVFGLWGKTGVREKKLEVFKNREAESLEIKYLAMNNHMRFAESNKIAYDYHMGTQQKGERRYV